MDEIHQDAALNETADRIAEGLRGMPYDDLLKMAATAIVIQSQLEERLERCDDDRKQALEWLRYMHGEAKRAWAGQVDMGDSHEAERTSIMERATEKAKQAYRNGASKAALAGANALHDKPGGSRDRVAKIRAAWASGKYRSRTECAEIGGRELGMSYDAARRALRNTPDPA